jgi:hypothetical protein
MDETKVFCPLQPEPGEKEYLPLGLPGLCEKDPGHEGPCSWEIACHQAQSAPTWLVAAWIRKHAEAHRTLCAIKVAALSPIKALAYAQQGFEQIGTEPITVVECARVDPSSRRPPADASQLQTAKLQMPPGVRPPL